MTEELLKEKEEHGYEEYTENAEREAMGCGCGGSEGGCCKTQGITIKKQRDKR